MMNSITITQPDDWHIHLREDTYLKHTVTDASRHLGKALIMPNLSQPVITVADALRYRDEILAHSISDAFKPFMTLYLTGKTTVHDVYDAAQSPVVKGIKWYPKHGTTLSEHSINDISECSHVLSAMSEVSLPLLIHGELAQYPVFDREANFIKQIMQPLAQKFTNLPMVIEHISTKEAVDFVYNSNGNIAATITPQHLAYDFTHLISSRLDPHYFCMPVLKTPQDKEAIRQAAISGDRRFFAGTDSAPHPRSAKECTGSAAGCYSAYHSLELYCNIFSQLDALDKLDNFLSCFGTQFYNEPRNTGKVTLVKKAWTIPDTLPFGDEVVVPLGAGTQLDWQIDA